MNFTDFVNAYLGKGTDYDGVYGVQCVDIINVYLNKVFRIKAGACLFINLFEDKSTIGIMIQR